MRDFYYIIQLKNDLKEVPVLIDQLYDLAKNNHLSQRFVHHLSLVLDELVTNIINYAYQNSFKEHIIQIEFTKKQNWLEVKLIDDGIAFDPLSVQEPDLHASLEQRKIGGLGIYFAKLFSSSILYKREQNKNILTIGFDFKENLTNKDLE